MLRVAFILALVLALAFVPRAAVQAEEPLSDHAAREIICAPVYAWDCETAMAVAYAESRLYPAVVNPSSGCACLFQIHPIHGYSVEALSDPVVCTRVAYKLFLESGWAPWGIR